MGIDSNQIEEMKKKIEKIKEDQQRTKVEQERQLSLLTDHVHEAKKPVHSPPPPAPPSADGNRDESHESSGEEDQKKTVEKDEKNKGDLEESGNVKKRMKIKIKKDDHGEDK